MYKIISNTFIISIFCGILIGQEIPNEFYNFQKTRLFIDSGLNWENNTSFGPVRFKHFNTKSDSLIINARFGSSFFNDKKSIYAYGHFTYNKNFHGYLYPRIVDKPDLFRGFSGIPRDIKRGGFSAGETDLSGISYENNWMIIQFGRGRQSWGTGNDIQLALSEQSNAYDYGMLDLNFNKLRTRYFHGYLEGDSSNVNRYIIGRGLEWNNHKDLLIALSEIIIYSGENRPIDFSYFNPMSTHLEIELNDRQNNLGTDSGNGVWQLSFDYLIKENIRMSGNYLFDEFIIDQEQKDEGKEAAKAYSFKFVYTPLLTKDSFLSFNASVISVGTNTFKHEYGNNNFVQRNRPLGWVIGSDSREIQTGINWLYRNRIISSLCIGSRLIGEKNLINNLYGPYADYFNEPFPSGSIEEISFGSAILQWWYKPNISIISEFEINNSNKKGNNIEFSFGIDIFYGISTKL